MLLIHNKAPELFYTVDPWTAWHTSTGNVHLRWLIWVTHFVKTACVIECMRFCLKDWSALVLLLTVLNMPEQCLKTERLPGIGQFMILCILHHLDLAVPWQWASAAQAAVAGTYHMLFILKRQTCASSADLSCTMMTAATLCTVMQCSVSRHLICKEDVLSYTSCCYRTPMSGILCWSLGWSSSYALATRSGVAHSGCNMPSSLAYNSKFG